MSDVEISAGLAAGIAAAVRLVIEAAERVVRDARRHQLGVLLTPEVHMVDKRGKAPSKNSPSTATSADKRLKGNGGKKPGPKPKS